MESTGSFRRRGIESVWGPAVDELLLAEADNLLLLEIMLDAAENDYARLCELRKTRSGIRDRDIRHAQRLIEVRRAAFEKEYARLVMEHPDEEEVLIRRLAQTETPPMTEEELIERFEDLSDPVNPWRGLDESDPDF